jgi:predicted HTH transcriptional regulator
MTPKIQEALDQLIQAIQEETVASFTSLLKGGQVGNGRSISRAPKARPKGGKRTAEDLEQLKNTIVAAIKKTPGVRSEELAKSLGTSTKELQLPMLQLRQDGVIRMKGQKRAAQYTVKG